MLSDTPALRTRYSVVLLQGLAGFKTFHVAGRKVEYFRGLTQLCEAQGIRCHTWKVPNEELVDERAKRILAELRKIESEGPFNLIAHSMGGLDARWLISQLGAADLVASLTTVATPHHGTEAAELRNRWITTPQLVKLVWKGERWPEHFQTFTREWSLRFNDACSDMKHVRCRAWAGNPRLLYVTPLLQPLWILLNRAEGPNDGLVSVQSARWCDEFFAGNLPADHAAQIGWKLGLNHFDQWDHLTFYRGILKDLADAGL